jgi:N-terminal acetyltransferase B complex non-catalytic subunit
MFRSHGFERDYPDPLAFPLAHHYQIDHDFVLGVAKKLTDSRKKVTEGVGKGMARLCASYH